MFDSVTLCVVCVLFYLEVYCNFNIEVPDIPLVGLETEHSRELLPLGAGEIVLQVEHRLFPVSVRSLWGCGEANPLVAVGELNVKKVTNAWKLN